MTTPTDLSYAAHVAEDRRLVLMRVLMESTAARTAAAHARGHAAGRAGA